MEAANVSQPPELMRLNDYADWQEYEDAIYAEYLAGVAHAGLYFCGALVKVRFIPTTKHKGYGFWHLISEAPSRPIATKMIEFQIWTDAHGCAGLPGVSRMQTRKGSHGGKTSVALKFTW